MQREREKRRKAEEKRKRRLERKAGQANAASKPDHDASNDLANVVANDPSTITNETGNDLNKTDD